MKSAAATVIGLTLLVVAGAVGCSTRLVADQNSGAVLPSELAAHPERYDGKHVDVRDYIVLGPEARNIFDSEKGFSDPHGACLGSRYAGRKTFTSIGVARLKSNWILDTGSKP